MGKDKSSQRTKGNQKPSSSGRTAELLGGVGGFIGFSALSDLGYVPAANNGGREDDSAISSDFRVALRKMSKKDATTKIKALQEFSQLCESEDFENIKTVLPFWPRLYSKLSIDIERRVREAAQTSHAALLAQTGKNIAPYLKSLMPTWLLAMCDPHNPSAAIATKAFQASFSEEKRPGVMFFSCKEIFDHVQDNLFTQTPESLSDPKTTSPEEMESKYTRVISCSLSGVCIFLSYVSATPDKKAEVSMRLRPIFDNEKFWKLSKDKNPLVRSMWFSLIKSIFEYDTFIMQDYASLLAQSIFPAMADEDASVLSHIWIAFLHFAVGIPDCWDHCPSPRKLFTRMFSVLQDGCRGNATELGPQLLPILSVIPTKVLEDRSNFYVEFLKSISTGLRKEKIISSSRDLSALLTALFECLKYISKENTCSYEIWETIMNYQVIDLLKSSYIDCISLSRSVLYKEVTIILSYWNVWAQENSHKPLSQLSELFWKLFLPICQQILDDANKQQLHLLQTFFIVLKDPTSSVVAKSGGVKFVDEIMKSNLANKQNVKDLVNRDIFICHTSKHLSSFIKDCFDRFKQKNNINVYKCFATILSLYPSKEMFNRLLSSDKDSTEKKNFIPSEVFDVVILPAMEQDNIVLIESAVKVFMALYSLLSQDEQMDLLNIVYTVMNDVTLKVLVENLLDKMDTDPVVVKWLQSSQLNNRILLSVRHLFDSVKKNDIIEDNAFKNDEITMLIKFVLSNANKKELVFCHDVVQKVMEEIKSNFPEPNHKLEVGESYNDKTLLLILDLTRHLFNQCSCNTIEGVEDYLYSLFLQICQNPLIIQDELYSRLKSVFIESLMMYTKANNKPEELLVKERLLFKILNKVKELVFDSTCSYKLAIELSDLIMAILKSLRSQENHDDTFITLDDSTVQIAMDMILPKEGEWFIMENNLSPLYLVPDILQGSINFREFLLPYDIDRDPEINQDYVRVSAFLVNIINGLCDPPVPKPDEGTELVSLGSYIPAVINALHAVCHSTSLASLTDRVNGEAGSNLDSRFGTNHLEKNMKILLAKLNHGNKKLILKQIRDRCCDGSSFWCVTLKTIFNKSIFNDIDAVKLMDSVDENSLGSSATKQALLPLLPKDEIVDILVEETSKLASLMDDPYSAGPCISLITTALSNLSTNVAEDNINILFDVLIHWRETMNNIFLFAADISMLPWEDISMIVNVIRLVTVIVKCHATHLQHSYWDFILCSQSSWIQSLQESLQSLEKETVVGMFCSAICHCVGSVTETMEALRVDKDMQDKLPSTLLTEWDEFFSPSVFGTLLPLFINFTKNYENNKTVLKYEICRSICTGVCRAGSMELTRHTLPPLFIPNNDHEDFTLPKNHQILLNHLTELLVNKHPPTQYASYLLLDRTLPLIMTEWDKNQMNIKDDDEPPARPLPMALTNLINEAASFLEGAIGELEIGSDCIILPHTDSYVYTFAYLLGWKLVHKALTLASETHHHQYSCLLRDSELHPNLLMNLFKIMPQKPFINSSASTDTQNTEQTMFNNDINIMPSMPISSKMVSWLACRVYIDSACHLPAAVRLWWTNLDRYSQQIVDKFTKTYVSPVIIQQELNVVNKSQVSFENMSIRTRPSAREVVATYTIDETSMELVLRMPVNHPLSTVTVEDHKRVGVSITQWRNCMLGLNIHLSHRNTPLDHSLAFWKKNIDQMFEGVEECYICYYVLHGTNHQLPKLLCRTCKKKFHSVCLYKWFSTSNNSTCPLCRSLF